MKGPIVTPKQRPLLYLALILLKSQETCAAFKNWKIINFQPTRLDQDLVDDEINGTLNYGNANALFVGSFRSRDFSL